MGVEDVLLSMDLGWTETAHHHRYQHRHRAPSVVHNIATLSSMIAAAPTQPFYDFRRTLELGHMVSLTQPVQLAVEPTPLCGSLPLGRALSVSVKQMGSKSSLWRSLPGPSFLVRVLFLGVKTFFLDLCLNLWLGNQHLWGDAAFSWRGLGRDLRRCLETSGSEMAIWLFPAWAVMGWFVSVSTTSRWPQVGWAPSVWPMYLWIAFGGFLFGWWWISKREEEEEQREKAHHHARLEDGLESPESTSDEANKALSAKFGAGKRRCKARKPSKRKKNTVTF